MFMTVVSHVFILVYKSNKNGIKVKLWYQLLHGRRQPVP